MFAVDKEECTFCGVCKDVCPCDAIIEKDNCCAVDMDLCSECGACYDACEFGAIVEGKREEIEFLQV